jgi:formate dehydrogenase major subunit
MGAKPPSSDPRREAVVSPPKRWAAGAPAVADSLRRSVEDMGVVTSARTLLRLNQTGGYDCPGCAWPDPEHRKHAEFCENGAKHVAAATTEKHVPTGFFADHSLSELATKSDWWLEEQGRLVAPLVKRAGSNHYEEATWDEALDLVANQLLALRSPEEATFYTSGRTSNEAAFVYQLFVRAFGTNNLPDCSNMCHESSGSALSETIGVGKGSVTLSDLESAELIVICGQNPGSNHPRMLTHLENAKRNGATIVAVNPLPEAGLLRFKNPQQLRGLVGRGTVLADEHLPIRLAGDQALFLGVGKLLLEREDAAPGSVLDQDFLTRHTDRFAEYADYARHADWAQIEAASGLERAVIERLANRFAASRRTIVCWAMGLTQHRNSVPMIREIVNVLLLQGNIGKPGAGVFPVRGHSNVQGDRTMGIWERMPDAFLEALGREFSFEPPRSPGLDAVDSVSAMRAGRIQALICLGGNLVRAISDSEVAEAAIRRLRLSVSIATKLNRSHVVTGDIAVLLPCLGRTERDLQRGVPQRVTVEDSVGSVHASEGRIAPASAALRSEVAIICDLAARTLARSSAPGAAAAIDWQGFVTDYARIRDHIEHVVPGFEAFNEKIDQPAGFLLPHAPRDSRQFNTDTGRAHFSVNVLRPLVLPDGCLILQTIRSHDQFNTTVYGFDDRYRGVSGGRDVVLVHPQDLRDLGFADGDRVDVVSQWHDGMERRLSGLKAVAYPTARGCAAGYYPECNVLVPLDSVAETSNTPTSKSVIVRLLPHQSAAGFGGS